MEARRWKLGISSSKINFWTVYGNSQSSCNLPWNHLHFQNHNVPLYLSRNIREWRTFLLNLIMQSNIEGKYFGKATSTNVNILEQTIWLYFGLSENQEMEYKWYILISNKWMGVNAIFVVKFLCNCYLYQFWI